MPKILSHPRGWGADRQVLVIHFIDMIACQDHDIVYAVTVNDINVLCDGIGGAAIPHIFRYALGCRQNIQKFIAFWSEKIPPALAMPDQRMRLVLGGHCHAANARIHRIGQGKIHNAGFAAEIHRRFDPAIG